MNRWLICLVALFAVAGCGAQPRPEAASHSPSVTPTPSATTPLVAAPPEMPRAAGRNSPDGATAFANYFIAIRNYAVTTGDTDELRRIIAPECFTCLEEPALIEVVHRAGGHIKGGLWTASRRVAIVPCSACGAWSGRGFMQGAIAMQPTEIVAKDGRSLGRYPGTSRDRSITLSASWRDGHWYVEDFGAIGGQPL